MRRLAAAAAVAVAALVLPGSPATAHPLGNFTVNTYAGLRVGPERIDVDLVIDMAEIPTFQARRSIDRDGDGISEAEGRAYAEEACPEAAGRLEVAVDGRAVPVRPVAGTASVTFPPGAAGLDTLRLTCAMVADTGSLRGEQEIVVQNRNYDDRVGWRELAAVGDGTTLVASDVGRSSVSERLARYPEDQLRSPLDQRVATLRARPGGPPAPPGFAPGRSSAGPAPRGVDSLTRSFTQLVGRQRLTPAFGLLALFLSVLLGAVHAFAPGHGKTVMAAYLVGRRGSVRQAAVIGLTVTLTHTAGVLVLGLVLSASTALAPERVYPWLGLASGLLLGAIGAGLLRGALRRPSRGGRAPELVMAGSHALGGSAPTHSHGPGGHSHPHPHPHPHSHAPDGGGPGDGGQMGWRGLTALGFAGGLVPSPSALVVLLGAIALGRAWLGVALVVGYGLGMAATLTGAGLLLVRFRGALDRRASTGGRRRFAALAAVAPVLPALTAVLIMGVGALLSVRALAQL